MEDETFVGSGGRFVAVFDGHGGDGVSRLLKQRLYNTANEYLEEAYIIRQARQRAARGSLFNSSGLAESHSEDDLHPNCDEISFTIPERIDAMRQAFADVEKAAIADDKLRFQGSTAVTVVVHEAKLEDCTTAATKENTKQRPQRTLLAFNVGDSRAVLSRESKAIDMTTDHKLENSDERDRIKALGEPVQWDEEAGMFRVRNLAVARSIGDRDCKPIVSSEVEIRQFPVDDDKDEFVVLASDGLWDVMSSQDVVSFIHKNTARGTARAEMSKIVAREALRRGSFDNISVVIVWLQRRR
jgi:serine/threonine protein phosphatase PrpC